MHSPCCEEAGWSDQLPRFGSEITSCFSNPDHKINASTNKGDSRIDLELTNNLDSLDSKIKIFKLNCFAAIFNLAPALHVSPCCQFAVPRGTFNFFRAISPAFLYTTLSHTPDHPKCRAVFITDAPFSEPDHYRRAKRAVMAQLPWGDASVHDPARLFYGSHPYQGQNHFLGNLLHLSIVDQLIEQHRTGLEAEQPRRELPRIQASRIMGATPAERYVNTAIQQEAAWVSSRIEGTGERHKGLLISAMKLASLSLSEWLPPEVRGGIDVHALLLSAAQANGYVSKYGESAARQTIADGIAYARPRLSPDSQNSSKPRLRWSGGQWVKAVRA